MLKKWKQKIRRLLSLALTGALVLGTAPVAVSAASGIEAEDGAPQDVYGSVTEAPDIVNLTVNGEGDWVHFNSRQTDAWERKNIKTPLIQEAVLLGEPENLATDTKSNFVYSDGTNQENSAANNHIGLILYGQGNGLRFEVPGSPEEQILRLYIGSWASEVEVTLSVNEEIVYTETYGKSETTSGAENFEHEIHYKTPSAQDKVSVQVKMTKLYDQSWGNINLQAIALAKSGENPESGITVSVLENKPEISLSEEGNVDWMYFNSTELINYEYKNIPDSYLGNVTAFVEASGLTGDRFVSFQYQDGTLKESNADSYLSEKRGIIFNHANNGMSFDVKGCTHDRTLRVYMGAYAATVEVSIYLNDQEAPLDSAEYTSTASEARMAEIRLRTAYPEDVIHVHITVKAVTDAAYGSASVHAVTLYDENPPEIEKPDYSQEILGDETGMIQVDHAKGKINSLQFKETDGNWLEVPFQKNGAYAGPAWKINGAVLRVVREEDDPHTYTAQKNGITYKLHYGISADGILTVTASVENNTDEVFEPDQASIVLGLNTYMEDTYDSYKGLFFPTLLRCEKTHLWGYMESPSKKVVSLAVDAPVSSYHLEYQSGQHRIYTAILDMMQRDETLPERHPRNNYALKAGESRNWNIKMKVSKDVDSVKEDIEKMLQAPVIDADRYTIGAGETSNITVYAADTPEPMEVTAPNGKVSELELTKVKDGVYTASLTPDDIGVYKLIVRAGDYQSEAMITLRQTWKWYMQKAKEAAISHPAKGADCAESWYNLYTAYLGEKYFPDEEQRRIIDNKFEEIYERVIRYDENGVPERNPNRIQNHSTTLGILVDKYEAQKDTKDLILAAKIADYLISRQNASTGAYMGPSGDYTSVIYPAKSIMELMKQEAKLIEAQDTSYDWSACYSKQYDSVKRAMDNLVELKGDLHTEGQLTFEDGAFSCSATQLSEFALMHKEGSAEREKYMQSTLDYLNKHQALEQEIIPDSRINGGSLRFWEAQYDVLLTASPNNMMNSPHGWTAWSIYAMFNMYQLTGDEYYLRKGMNSIGSCAQLMDFNGNLNWAFIADPYIKGSLFVQKENDTSEYGEGTRQNVTLGESYVDMISDWWRTPPDTSVGGYYGQGGACDNDVHEIFKAMEETVLTKAYVIEQEDGTFMSYNCAASKDKNDKLIIHTADGELIDEVSLNLNKESAYEIYFANTQKTVCGTAVAGMAVAKESDVSAEKVTKIEVTAEKTKLTPGEKTMAVAAVTPQTAANTEVVWSSSNEDAATVDGRGEITAVAEGEADIIATAADGSDVQGSIHIEVVNGEEQNPGKVTGIKVTAEKTKLTPGEKTMAEAAVTPQTAANTEVVWSSSNEDAATVDGRGEITAVAEGEADIIATATDGSDVQGSVHIEVVNSGEQNPEDPSEEREKLESEVQKLEKEYADLSKYTGASAEAFKKALEAANAVLSNPDATKEEIDEALRELTKAANALSLNDTGDKKPQLPKVGETFAEGILQYQVTKSDAANGTVKVVKLLKKSKKVVIPASVSKNSYTFKVTEVDKEVFQKNNQLKEVVFGANIAVIGAKSFFKCKRLKKITFEGTKAPKAGSKAFNGIKKTAKVMVPKNVSKKELKKFKKTVKSAGKKVSVKKQKK